MLCVRCGGEMEKRQERGVLLDFCPPCRAVWLDGGELEALEEGRDASARELSAERRTEAAREAGQAVTAVGLCPRCQRRLDREVLEHVEVDRCGACGGLFFDGGELAKVLRARTW